MLPAEPCQRHIEVPEYALITYIMYGEHGCGSTEIFLVQRFHINRNKSGLPVMGVDNIGFDIQFYYEFQYRP